MCGPSAVTAPAALCGALGASPVLHCAIGIAEAFVSFFGESQKCPLILAGQRVEKSVIKRGVDACHVEAIFLLSGDVLRDFDLWLDSAGLPACEEGALVLSRSVSRTRAPKIQINGKVATLAKLRELGGYWIDFHGPHEPQKLANPRFQLNMVDLFGRY